MNQRHINPVGVWSGWQPVGHELSVSGGVGANQRLWWLGAAGRVSSATHNTIHPRTGPTAAALEVVEGTALPALVLEVPSERIVAASDAAVKLIGTDRASVVGRSLEEFTADAPTGALDLVASRPPARRGLEASTKPGAEPVPLQVWVRLLGEATRGRFVIAVMSTAASQTIEPLPRVKEEGRVIGTVDQSLLIERISHDTDDLLHRPPEELLGKPFLTMVAEQDATALLWALAQAASSRRGVTSAIRVVTGDGSWTWVQLVLVPLSSGPQLRLRPRRLRSTNRACGSGAGCGAAQTAQGSRRGRCFPRHLAARVQYGPAVEPSHGA